MYITYSSCIIAAQRATPLALHKLWQVFIVFNVNLPTWHLASANRHAKATSCVCHLPLSTCHFPLSHFSFSIFTGNWQQQTCVVGGFSVVQLLQLPLQQPLMSYCQVVEVPGQKVDAAFR